jgi:hypothetical protein
VLQVQKEVPVEKVVEKVVEVSQRGETLLGFFVLGKVGVREPG